LDGIANYIWAPAEGIESFLRVVELNPAAKVANYHLGVNFASLGQYDKAIHHFKLVVRTARRRGCVLSPGHGLLRVEQDPGGHPGLQALRGTGPGDRRAAQMLEMLTNVPGV